MRDVIETILFWTATILGAASVCLIGVNLVLVQGNSARQAEFAQRADLIAAMAQRSRATPLVRDLVLAAQKEQNSAIRALLARYGIPYQAPQPAAAAAVAPPPSAQK